MIINNDTPFDWRGMLKPIMNDQLANEMEAYANHMFHGAGEAPGAPVYGALPPAPCMQMSCGSWAPPMESFENQLYYFERPLPDETANMKQGKPKMNELRGDFPILSRTVNGKPLVWLDNAATTQKPRCVIDETSRYYAEYNSNIHRGAHQLAKEATEAYEDAREKISRFIGAAKKDEIIFVRGTTEAINLVACTWGMANITEGDEIILTQMEHHSNIVPWQMLAKRTGAVLKAVPIDEQGELMLNEYEKLFTHRTRLVAASQVSNVLGTVNPIERMAQIAHAHGALILVDGAQSTPHMPVDVQRMDADFFTFSGHKVYGPTGIGVLYGKYALLEQMDPYQGGGGMIKTVTLNKTAYANPPGKFEAGTGNIAGAVGLGAAVDYLQNIGMDSIHQYEQGLTRYLMRKMSAIPGVRIIGTSPGKTSVVSFLVNDIDPGITARYLDQQGIAIRAGHHCAQPALNRFGLKNAARASIGLYNTMEEMDIFAAHITKLAEEKA